MLATATYDQEILSVQIGDQVFHVEPAVTPLERTLGLSGRTSIPRDGGMMFVFETEGQYGFWMKDMEFPLDLIWIDSDCYVTDLTENANPADNDSDLSEIISYVPQNPVQYVLEINGGLIEVLGIRKGATVVFTPGLGESYGC